MTKLGIKTLAPPRMALIYSVSMLLVGHAPAVIAQSLPARVSWDKRVELIAPMDGMVDRVAVSVGAKVSKGDVLIELNASAVAEALAIARAKLAHKKAAFDNAGQSRAQQQELHELGAATNAALMRAEQQFELASVDLNAAKLSLAAAEHRAELTTLRAPFDAWVVAVNTVENQWVRVADYGVPVVILGSQALRVNFNVPHTRINQFVLGTEVIIHFDDERTHDAVVTFLQPEPRLQAGELVYSAGARLSVAPEQRVFPGATAKVKLK
jgi:RND family efflux transporter MFP subunit